MARTAVPVTKLAANGSIANPAGTAVDPTNGHVISGARFRKLLIRVTNTNGTDRLATVKAGAYPPAESSGLGDLVVTVPATTGDVLIGPLESARFSQANGDILVNLGASIAGVIAAIALPDTY
jgi:hypothetical protein